MNYPIDYEKIAKMLVSYSFYVTTFGKMVKIFDSGITNLPSTDQTKIRRVSKLTNIQLVFPNLVVHYMWVERWNIRQ